MYLKQKVPKIWKYFSIKNFWNNFNIFLYKNCIIYLIFFALDIPIKINERFK